MDMMTLSYHRWVDMASLTSCCQGLFNCGGNTLVQPSRLALEHGRLRRPERFFAVFAPGAFPAVMLQAQTLQKRYRQILCLCLHVTIAQAVFKVIFSHTATGSAFDPDPAADCLREG